MEWYRWFPQIYNDKTLELTLEQDAIYRRLIDWYMTNRVPLPCSGIALARICQISLEKWKEHESVIHGFFTKKGDKYHLKRCDIELDRQDLTSKKLGEAARRAHDARKKNQAETMPSLPSQCQADAIPPIEVEVEVEVEDKESKKDTPFSSPIRKTPEEKTKRLTQLSKDWRPNDAHRNKCTEFGFNADALADDPNGFINYHVSRASRFADWDRAFFTWIGNAKKFSASNKGQSRCGGNQSSTPSIVAAGLRVAARYR